MKPILNHICQGALIGGWPEESIKDELATQIEGLIDRQNGK